MRLISARMCVDCEEIYDGDDFTCCPHCGSNQGQVWISTWIPSLGTATLKTIACEVDLRAGYQEVQPCI